MLAEAFPRLPRGVPGALPRLGRGLFRECLRAIRDFPKLVRGASEASEASEAFPRLLREFRGCPRLPRRFRGFPEASPRLPSASEAFPRLPRGFRGCPRLPRRFRGVSEAFPMLLEAFRSSSEAFPRLPRRFARGSRGLSEAFPRLPEALCDAGRGVPEASPRRSRGSSSTWQRPFPRMLEGHWGGAHGQRTTLPPQESVLAPLVMVWAADFACWVGYSLGYSHWHMRWVTPLPD